MTYSPDKKDSTKDFVDEEATIQATIQQLSETYPWADEEENGQVESN